MTNKDLALKVSELNEIMGHAEAGNKKFKVIYNMNRKYSLMFGTDVLMEFATADGAIKHLEELAEEGK